MKFAISAIAAAVLAAGSAANAASTPIDDALVGAWKNGIPFTTLTNLQSGDLAYAGDGTQGLTMTQVEGNAEGTVHAESPMVNGFGHQLTISDIASLDIVGLGSSATEATKKWNSGIYTNSSDASKISISAKDHVAVSGASYGIHALGGAIDITTNALTVKDVENGLVAQDGGQMNITAANIDIEAASTAVTSTSYGGQTGQHAINLKADAITVRTTGESANALSIDSYGSSTIEAQTAYFEGAAGANVAGTLTLNAANATFKTTAENGNAINLTGAAKAAFSNGTVTADGNITGSEGSTITADGTRFDLLGDSSFNQAGTFAGTNAAIVLHSEESSISIGTNTDANLAVVAASDYNDSFGSAEEARAALTKQTQITGGEGSGYLLSGEAGSTSDAWAETLDADGNKVMTSRMNASLAAYRDFNAATLAQWRNESNHLAQRLGDVRRNLGAAGAWARVYGYDGTVKKDANIDIKANSVQVGGDATVGGNWIVGGAFSYTNLNGDITNGSSESDGYSLAAYASGFFDCGGYIDVVGRIGRLSTDIDASTLSVAGGSLTGSYDNTAFGLSAEIGYRWNLSETFYAEPQFELAYGYVLGDDFTSSGNDAKVEQDDFQSLVGRLGAELGANFPNNAGRFYIEASVNYDFLGDADSTVSNRYGVKRALDADLGGTWFTYGVGMEFYAGDALSIYGSLDRSSGNAYEESYRYSIGARYVF